MAQREGLKDQLQLVILEGVSHFEGEALTAVKNAGKRLIPYFAAVAAVGSESKRTTFALKLYGFLSHTGTKTFDDEASAMEWLVSMESRRLSA